jgi:protease-4
MPESGSFNIIGLRMEMSFYKDLFEKIGVKADYLTMGEAKTAAEPFTRDKLSPESRKQYELVIDDLYEKTLVNGIVTGRNAKKMTSENVRKIIDESPFMAKRAKELGLVDQIAYPEAFEEMMKKSSKGEGVKVVRDYQKAKAEELDLSNPFNLLKLLNPPKKTSSKKPKIAVIYALGGINTGKSSIGLMGESMGSATMVEAIKEADKDATVKAIVLRVDSPGGSALASDLIWQAIRECKKPVIASMGDVAGSGGYYICMSAKKIYAEESTITGSIGVLGGKFVTKGVFDHIGIKTDVISRGKNSGIDSQETPFSESERKVVTALMQDIYDQFLDKALMGRQKAGVKMTREKLLTLAGGRIWTGRQAKENGLIDEVGTLDDALAEAKKLGGFADADEPELLVLPKPVNFLDSLLEGGGLQMQQSELNSLLKLTGQYPELRGHLREAHSILQLRNEKVWLRLPVRIEVK